MPVTRLSAGQTIIPRHSTHCKRVVRPCIVSFNRRSRRSRRRRVRALFFYDQGPVETFQVPSRKRKRVPVVASEKFSLLDSI